MFFLLSRLLEEKQALWVYWSATELEFRPPFCWKRSQESLKTDSWRGPSLSKWLSVSTHLPPGRAARRRSVQKPLYCGSGPLLRQLLSLKSHLGQVDQPLWVRWAVNEAEAPPLTRNMIRGTFPCFSVFTGYSAKRLTILYTEVKMNSNTSSPDPLNKVQKFANYTRLEFITVWYSLTGLWTEKTDPNRGT